jgi:choline transport protein
MAFGIKTNLLPRSIYAVLSELVSMMPIACGQYYWVYMLAPLNYKKFSSYIIGWLTSLAWIATVAIQSLLAGTMIQGLIEFNYPTYDSKQWQGFLFTLAIIAVNVFINVITPDFLPKFELMILVLHLVGFVAIIATLLSKAELGSASSVWLTAFNRGGWPTQGLSYCVGFLGNVATFVGADASAHLAEEVADAERTVPRAICISVIANGIIGFAMMIAVLYCLGDANSAIQTQTRFPFIEIFYNTVKSVGGTIGMSVIVLILTWGAAAGITTSASRMTWSFARDKGMPFSRYLSMVTKNSGIPVVAVSAVTIFAALLVLVYISSYGAFYDVISLTITGFYASYFLPCAFLLYRRLKGQIRPYGSPLPQRPDLESTFVWGPWCLPGVFGTINNAYACVYMIFIIFWSFWPQDTPVSANTMNYSIVVTGGVIILSSIWYVVWGHREYNGPVNELEEELEEEPVNEPDEEPVQILNLRPELK